MCLKLPTGISGSSEITVEQGKSFNVSFSCVDAKGEIVEQGQLATQLRLWLMFKPQSQASLPVTPGHSHIMHTDKEVSMGTRLLVAMVYFNSRVHKKFRFIRVVLNDANH